MHPTIHLGFLEISSYGLAYSVAFLVAGMVAYGRLQALALPRQRVEGFVLWAVAGAGLGLFAPILVSMGLGLVTTGAWPQDLAAMRVYYAVAGCLLACALYARMHPFPLLRAMDQACPAFPLGYGLARIGCFAAGCCGGTETDAFWAVYMPNEAGIWAMRYPTQLMSGLIQISIFVGMVSFLRWRVKRGYPADAPFPGFVVLLSTFLFGFERFFVEFFRADTIPLWGTLSGVHLGMAGVMLLCLGLLAAGLRRQLTLRNA
jgi:phosphatidylglycerol:prolipoprotein diacylglycerol transferase